MTSSFKKRQNAYNREMYKNERHHYETGIDATRIARLSYNQLESLINKLPDTWFNTHNVGLGFSLYWCEEAQNRLDKQGYPNGVSMGQVYGEDDNPNIYHHQNFRLAQIVLAQNGQFASHAKMQVSHLCANPKCIRFEHLIWETAHKNQQRMNCPGAFWVDNSLFSACTHTPPCIKITTKPRSNLPAQ